MMREQYADMARRWVRWLRPEAPPRLPIDRRRLVSAVEEALRERARYRTRVRWMTSVGTAAAAAAALVLVVQFGPGRIWPSVPVAEQAPAPKVIEQAPAPIGIAPLPPAPARGIDIEPGTQLVAPTGSEVHIDAADGTGLTLEPGGKLAVIERGATRRFALRHGAVRARGARLVAGERFIIDTADAEIEVHGTAFRVALGRPAEHCKKGPRTQVAVAEGVVSVRYEGREVKLLPGEEWPPACSAPPPASEAHHVVRRAAAPHAVAAAPEERPAPPAVAQEKQEDEGPPPAPPPAPARPLPPVPASVLAAQNDLFAAALRAKRRGRPNDAIKLFNTLVRKYPESPLLESALAQRMKLLAATDSWAASQAAADYLARFPGGFARAEAHRLAAASARP
jgi:ferric-dicitrate binding protein FerR (iron transport regulator)